MASLVDEVDYFAGRARYYLRRAREDRDDALRRAHDTLRTLVQRHLIDRDAAGVLALTDRGRAVLRGPLGINEIT
jgi:hypothetical protein